MIDPGEIRGHNAHFPTGILTLAMIILLVYILAIKRSFKE